MPGFFKSGNRQWEPRPRPAGFSGVTQRHATPKNPFALGLEEWRKLLVGAWADGFRDNLGLIAAGVAFFVMLAVFPALAAVVAIYGVFADPAAFNDQLDALAGVAPTPVLAIAREQMERLVHARAPILALHGLVSLLVALWGAQQGARSFLRALTIINERAPRRHFLKRYLVGGAFTIGALGVVIVTVSLFAIAPLVLEQFGTDAELALSLLRWPVLIALVTCFAMALYRWGPNRKAPRWIWIWPGALIAALSWLCVSAGFTVYVDHFTPVRAAYGVLSGVFVLMLWLFLSAYIFLLGAEINARLEQICAESEACGSPPAAKSQPVSTPDPLAAEPR